MTTLNLKQAKRILQGVFVVAAVCCTRTYAQSVSVTQTRGDQTVLLQSQNPISFSEGTLSNASITVNENRTRQTVDGFGFALTQGSAQALSTLNEATRNRVLDELFNPNRGTSVSIVRISIGASDLSNSTYTYNETPGDTNMDNFSLQGPDRTYVIPVLKKILAINPNIKILATPWTAPTWMKIDRDPNESDPYIGGRLNPIYYEAYARYFVKYLQAMGRQDISIWGITPQNEPENPFNQPSMSMTASEQLEFVDSHLGPDLDRAGFGAVKIIGFDHNCDNTSFPVEVAASRYVDGSAFHLYAGDISAMGTVSQQSGKDVFFTEQFTSSEGDFDGDFGWHMENVVIGALTHFSKTVIEWNVASFQNHTPKTPRGCSDCLGAITVNNSSSISKNVSYYIISQISQFVKVGATRLETSSENILNVAFRNPNGDKVLLVYNRNSGSQSISVNWNGRSFRYTMPGRTAVTFVWGNWEGSSSTATITNGYYRLKNVATGRYLQSSGSEVRTSTSASGNSKQWRFVKSGNYYNIDSKPRGVLRAKGSSALVSTSLAPPNTANDKRWTVIQLNDGTYRFKSKSSNKYIYNSTENDNLVATHSTSTNTRSKWRLEFVSTAKNVLDKNNEIKGVQGAVIHPNPTTGASFNILLPEHSGKTHVVISDMLGKRVYETTTDERDVDIQDAGFAKSGLYLVKLTSAHLGVYTQKLIVR